MSPTAAEIASFHEDEPPAGADPFVFRRPVAPIVIAEPDPRWPQTAEQVIATVRRALGPRCLRIEHVGSTAVPGLPAKPLIDLDLIVARPDRESDYVPALTAAGFVLSVREPWWHEHRMFIYDNPDVNLHVFSPSAPEPWKHIILRDHLRANPRDRERYADAKRAAAAAATAAGERVMEYNARKETALREILLRALAAAGCAPEEPAADPRQ
ncbi:GrpB family protein [Microbacterium sp. GXS0129]|uniref:GrpB family protein n=1 Tax=Microbacterium sp. GXS0129 TaxID=3377836 RepID=UPI00383B5435